MAGEEQSKDTASGREHAVAVAVGYDTGAAAAPTVLASGKGALAEQILEIAFAAGVKVRQDADLAEILSLVDVGEEIPAEAFVAVAEVLQYVYQANRQAPPPSLDE